MNLLIRILSVSSASIASIVAGAESARDELVQLERFEVTGIPPETSVNPLTRPMEGVFGDIRGILETPRSVSLIVIRPPRVAGSRSSRAGRTDRRRQASSPW